MLGSPVLVPLTPSPALSVAAEILGGARQQQAMPSPRVCVSPSTAGCPPLTSPWHASGNYFSHISLKSALLLTWPVTVSNVQTARACSCSTGVPQAFPSCPGSPREPLRGLQQETPPLLCGAGAAPSGVPGAPERFPCSGTGMPPSSEQSWTGVSRGKWCCPGLQVAFLGQTPCQAFQK